MLGPLFSWCQPTTAWATKSKTCHLQSRDRFELICNRLEKDQPLHSSLQKTRLKPCIAWRTLVWANASSTSQLHDRDDGHFGDYAGDGHDGETFQDFHSWQNFVRQQDTSPLTDRPTFLRDPTDSSPARLKAALPGETLHDVKMERHTLEAPALSLEPELGVCLVNWEYGNMGPHHSESGETQVPRVFGLGRVKKGHTLIICVGPKK